MNNYAAGAIGGVAALAVAASAVIFANHRSEPRPYEDAAIEEAAPKEVATKTVCTEERVVRHKDVGTNSVAGTVLGGVAGGVLGHQIGGGRGKDVATAVGAVGGAYAGNRIAKEKYPDKEVSYKQTCREVPVS